MGIMAFEVYFFSDRDVKVERFGKRSFARESRKEIPFRPEAELPVTHPSKPRRLT
jgi:hypothetical protein